ncbi:hypothetical protein OPKNFCMD_0230 [Methylobacterium crusticola]|uniref:Uncharacterized protein n=1 Tax=Methylobacterium crusticola TaxID=1697972 RepID=A0ABQ4QQR0_9HYPH|nr:hypothetical protein [Methylobacterium crusticola]GJD47522.1 hypothetical protein OPKNFCMD_0230 [Methylobacterium crusticola]
MFDPGSSPAPSAREILHSLTAIGQAVHRLNAAGRNVRVSIVPDGLWIDGRTGAGESVSELIPTADLHGLASYALVKTINDLAGRL